MQLNENNSQQRTKPSIILTRILKWDHNTLEKACSYLYQHPAATKNSMLRNIDPTFTNLKQAISWRLHTSL